MDIKCNKVCLVAIDGALLLACGRHVVGDGGRQSPLGSSCEGEDEQVD
jgi:hypothetical protein